ncbi:hypothetical protein [Treponema phagedenis]|nr:hypothetical protein [Treponema phagedenis]QKS93330.1 hypothetical protein HPJ96_12810 [Treponema phagedenis]
MICSCVSSSSTIFKNSDKVLVMTFDGNALKYYLRPEIMLGKDKNSSVNIDFSYQKRNDAYISDSYTNFTLNYNTSAYIQSAQFNIPGKEPVVCNNITTLNRNVSQKFIRVQTIVLQKDMETLMNSFEIPEFNLSIELTDGTVLFFTPSKTLIETIREEKMR